MEFFNHIHCKYTGLKGFITLYNYALRYRYMITQKALHRMKVLLFYEKYGMRAAQEAFSVSRRTVFYWKKRFSSGGKKPEALNEKKRIPLRKRKRLWPEEVTKEIIRIRIQHPNLGKEKLYPLLQSFCMRQNVRCPQPKTIGRIIKDQGGLRISPVHVSHFGKIRPFKRQKVLRKPKDFKAQYPGHCVALDTVERFVNGCRRYLITFEDLYTRYGFAWATTSHASRAAKEFFERCTYVFPFAFNFLYVLTDNGSEFKKHFSAQLQKLHLTHYHTYPKTPKMNAHCERFNRTLQEEFVDYHERELSDPSSFNRLLIDWLVWYNTERVHYAFHNTFSPIQFMLSPSCQQRIVSSSAMSQECKNGWPHTGLLVLKLEQVLSETNILIATLVSSTPLPLFAVSDQSLQPSPTPVHFSPPAVTVFASAFTHTHKL